MAKINVKRKRQSRVIRLLKKSVSAIMIIKRILDFGVNLTVTSYWLLLRLLKNSLQKQLQKTKQSNLESIL